MKIGIIIIFHNNEKDIDKKKFIEHLNATKNLELCLVNNCSKDKTYQLLKEIKEGSETNLSIVNIKKFKSDEAAVRAGARYMFNEFNLNHLGYVSTNLLNLKRYGLNRLIKAISENQNFILKYNIETLERKEIKLTLFQSVFSVIEYLKKIKVGNHLTHYHFQSKF